MIQSSMKVALIGPGQIGLDLLYKIKRSDLLNCTLVAGKNLGGKGLTHASDMGFTVSEKGINALIEAKEMFDLVFDATDANSHKNHWAVLQKMNKKIIDLTPSNIGCMYIPYETEFSNEYLFNDNINLISCGGQASIPILACLSKQLASIDYVEVITTASSQSAGRAARINIDEYIFTTEAAIKKFAKISDVKVMLNLSAAIPPVPFRVIIHLIGKNFDFGLIEQHLQEVVKSVRRYAPGYKLLTVKKISDSRIYVSVEVQGHGDFLPTYSGNLDIINSAAVFLAEKYATSLAKTSLI